MAQRSRLSASYIGRTVFGHPEPGARVLNWVLMRVAPMNYPVFALAAAVGIAATSWVIYRILRLVFRPSPAMAVLAWLAGAIVIWMPPAMWWASAMELVPCALGSAMACHATVRCYLGPRRIVWGVLAGVWLVLALSCYERALVGAAVSLVFVPLAVCDRIRPRQVLAVARQAWPAYTAVILVTMAYLAKYLSGQYVQTHGGYSTHDLIDMLWWSWSHSLVPGLLGGPLDWHYVGGAVSLKTGVYPVGQPPEWWVVLGQVVALSVLVAGIRRLGWRSLRGWAMFVPLYFGTVYAVATARLAMFGPQVGDEMRYVADLVPMVTLALGLALLRPRFAGTQPAPVPIATHAAAGRALFDRRAALLAGAFLAVTAPIVAASALPASNKWATNPTKTYVANLRRSLAEADRGSRWSLYNTIAPNWFMTVHYSPYSTMEYLGQLVTGRPVPMNDPTARLLVVNAEGTAVAAAFRSTTTVPDHCTTRPNETVVLPLHHPVDGSELWFLVLRYTTTEPSTLRLTMNPGTGFINADAQGKSFPVHDSGTMLLQLRRLPIQQLRIRAAQPGACVTDVRIGVPVPAGG
jgi:hypothetical protein